MSSGEHLHCFHQMRTDCSQCCQAGCLICTVRAILWHMQRRTWADFQCLVCTKGSSVKWPLLLTVVFKPQCFLLHSANHQMVSDRWKGWKPPSFILVEEKADNIYRNKTIKKKKINDPLSPLFLIWVWKPLHQLKFHQVGLKTRRKKQWVSRLHKNDKKMTFLNESFPVDLIGIKKKLRRAYIQVSLFSGTVFLSLLVWINQSEHHNQKMHYIYICQYTHFLQSKKCLWQCTCILNV